MNVLSRYLSKNMRRGPSYIGAWNTRLCVLELSLFINPVYVRRATPILTKVYNYMPPAPAKYYHIAPFVKHCYKQSWHLVSSYLIEVKCHCHLHSEMRHMSLRDPVVNILQNHEWEDEDPCLHLGPPMLWAFLTNCCMYHHMKVKWTVGRLFQDWNFQVLIGQMLTNILTHKC